MKLRYFQTYDENGVDSEVQLQYWDSNDNIWKNINLIRTFYLDESDALYNEELY